MDIQDLHIGTYLRVIYKRKMFVLVFFLVFVSAVTIGTLSQPPIYTATTKVIIEKSDPSVLPSQFNYYPYMSYDPEFYTTQYQLIKSSAVAGKVIERLGLREKYGRYFLHDSASDYSLPSLLGWLKSRVASDSGGQGPGGPEPSAPDVELLAKSISSGVTVTPIKDSRIVSISFSSGDPELSMLVANQVATAYIDQILEMRMSNSQYTLQWMTEKAEEERRRLLQKEDEFQHYIKNNDIVTLENRIAIIPQKLSELGAELIRAQSRMNELESVYAKLQGVQDLAVAETIPPISQDETLKRMRSDVIDAEKNVMEMSKTYGRKHPAMLRAEEELSAVRARRETEIRRMIASIKNEYELARTKVGSIQALFDETKREALALNEKFIQYEVMKKNLDAGRQLYEALIGKIKEQGFTENVRTVDVWILERAQMPKAPSAPNIPQNIMLAVLMGLFGGIGLAYMVEQLDNTVKSVEEAEEKLGVPMLGMVPLMRIAGKDIEGIVSSEPKSSYAESYKNIRTSLLLSSAGKPPESLLVTSMQPKEGKTATSLNLATAFVHSGLSVILLDADLRKPNVHRVLRLSNEQGLSSYLAGASELNINRITEGPLSGLHVVTAGPIPPNPSELISSSRMVELSRRLRDEYDLVLIDSSPLLSISDALILSKVVDGTILIARAERTTYGMLKKGIAQIQNVKSHLLGVVINALDMKKHSYYYYSYNYGYGYGQEEDGGKGRGDEAQG